LIRARDQDLLRHNAVDADLDIRKARCSRSSAHRLGKTTLLRMLAGMERRPPATSSPRARINDIREPAADLHVFSSALFPTSRWVRTSSSLKIRGIAKEERKARALALMKLRLPDHHAQPHLRW
jgi:ABC-type taurine transport system ATPase subunit